jgi:antitoxin VapB
VTRDSSTAKVFWSGRSQAVRLPKAYRIEAAEVRVWKEGNRLVLEPIGEDGWPEGFFDLFGLADDTLDLGDRTQPAERRAPLGRR